MNDDIEKYCKFFTALQSKLHPNIPCDICNETFESESWIELHKRISHKPSKSCEVYYRNDQPINNILRNMKEEIIFMSRCTYLWFCIKTFKKIKKRDMRNFEILQQTHFLGIFIFKAQMFEFQISAKVQ